MINHDIRTMSLADLTAAPYNPRQITEQALQGLTQSVKRFGLVQPIVWNRRTGHVIGGHQRIKVLEALGAKEAAVVAVDLPETEEKALNVALNSPVIVGEFTDELQGLLDEIRTKDPVMFDDLLLRELIQDLAVPLPLVEESSLLAPPAEPITQKGDLWKLGDHRLLCGDSKAITDFQRLMGDQKAMLIATDPPYGVDYVSKARAMVKRGYRHSQAATDLDIEADDMKGPELTQFLVDTLGNAFSFAAEKCGVYVWHSDARRREFMEALDQMKIFIHQIVIWLKPGFVIGRSNYHHRFEPCFHGWPEGKRPDFLGERNQSNVWEIGRENDKIHPTQKPVELFSIPIRNHTQRGDIVLEPFAGSGTQFIAAEQLGRRCFGIELEPKYCDVVIRRWENLTGRKAERESVANG